MPYFIIASLFLIWRLFLLLSLIVSDFFLSPRTGYAYTLLPYFLEKGSILSNYLLYPFGSFDGVHFLLIAANGYTVNAGFFPLFPLLINISTRISGSDVLPFSPQEFFTAVALVSVVFLAALYVFYKLMKLDYGRNTVIWSIVFLLVFPTSFFYAVIYSESLFLLLSLLCFYFARRNKWVWAGISGALLSATRLVGIAILPALLFEYFKNEKNKALIKLLSICLTPAGLIAYAFYNLKKWGNPFYFIQAQGNFANNRTVDSIVLFPQTMFRYFKILFTLRPNIYEWWVALFEFSFFVFGLIMFYIAWKKKVRASYLIFGVLCFLIPASTGTFSGLPRYMLPIFPLFVALSLIKNKVTKTIYVLISAILLFVFFMFLSKGYFIS